MSARISAWWLTVLRSIKAENILSEVIILTGNATLESAIECMKLGAAESRLEAT